MIYDERAAGNKYSHQCATSSFSPSLFQVSRPRHDWSSISTTSSVSPGSLSLVDSGSVHWSKSQASDCSKTSPTHKQRHRRQSEQTHVANGGNLGIISSASRSHVVLINGHGRSRHSPSHSTIELLEVVVNNMSNNQFTDLLICPPTSAVLLCQILGRTMDPSGPSQASQVMQVQ